MQARRLEADEDVVREGDSPSVCCLLVDGFMHRYKCCRTASAKSWRSIRRAICPTCKACFCGPSTIAWHASARAKVAFIPHQTLRALMRQAPTSPSCSGATR